MDGIDKNFDWNVCEERHQNIDQEFKSVWKTIKENKSETDQSVRDTNGRIDKIYLMLISTLGIGIANLIVLLLET